MSENALKYKPEYDKQSEIACKLGAVEQDLAEMFGVSRSTIFSWKNQFDSFRVSVQNGKDMFDSEQIENSVKSRALGTAKTREVRTVLDKEGKPIKEKIVIIERTSLPDVGACSFWLTHRNRERWGANKDTVPGKKGNFDKMLEKLADKMFDDD